MSLTCVLLLGVGALSTNVKVQLDVFTAGDIKIVVMVLVFLSGLGLSIYHAFTDRPNSFFEKFFMLFFAVVLNAFSPFAGTYGLTEQWRVAVFSIVNLVNGAALLFMLRSHMIDEESISDENASHLQIAFTAAVVIMLFAVCHYMFKLRGSRHFRSVSYMPPT